VLVRGHTSKGWFLAIAELDKKGKAINYGQPYFYFEDVKRRKRKRKI